MGKKYAKDFSEIIQTLSENDELRAEVIDLMGSRTICYNTLTKIIGINKQAIELLLLTSTMFGIKPISVATIKIKNPIKPEKYRTIIPINIMIKMLKSE